MAHVEAVRPRTVTIVQCDCGCGAECDSDFPDHDPNSQYTPGKGCAWISIPPSFRSAVRERGLFGTQGTTRYWPEATPLYFVDFRHLARWATREATIREIQVRALLEQQQKKAA